MRRNIRTVRVLQDSHAHTGARVTRPGELCWAFRALLRPLSDLTTSQTHIAPSIIVVCLAKMAALRASAEMSVVSVAMMAVGRRSNGVTVGVFL